jgi:predicted unusual protein kinase regulating ubiquinone biosynthesis (AarF/ABC1/UbiB family)
MRAFVVIFRLLPFVLAFLRDRRRWIVLGAPARRTVAEHRQRADRLVETLAALGPTFVKLGQVFAARADLLPGPYLAAMSRLTDQVPALAPGVAEQVIEAELGEPVTETFARFDAAPLAAASLGQVHRANYGGREVVVKVLRPGVETSVREDLDVAFRILNVLNILFPYHGMRAMSAIVNEFAKRIGDEMDYREEAQNADTMRRAFASERRVVVPEVVTGLTRRRVLVLEFVEGTRIDRLHDRIASGDVRLDELMRLLAEVYLKMMLEDGFLHADPHPGNLLIDPSGRLVLLDFGMVVRVEPELRLQLVQTVVAAGRQDVDGVVNGFYALGILDPDVDRGTVQDAARQLMSLAQREDQTPRSMQKVVEEVLQTFYEFPLTLPSDLVYFGRAAVLVEGVALRYDPNYNVVAVARPVLTRFAARLLGAATADARTRITDWGQEVGAVARRIREVVRRLERDELRMRWNAQDAAELRRFISQQVRRALLALFSFTCALLSGMVWMTTRKLYVLLAGVALSFGLFFLILVLPGHLFQNPLRFRRSWPER